MGHKPSWRTLQELQKCVLSKTAWWNKLFFKFSSYVPSAGWETVSNIVKYSGFQRSVLDNMPIAADDQSYSSSASWFVCCLCFSLCRFCAFIWNVSAMRWCIPSRSAATCPSRWRASTCSLSWLKRARPKSPHTICCRSFVTTALQEVRAKWHFSRTSKPLIFAPSGFIIFALTFLWTCRWTLHCLLSERHQWPVVRVWWPVRHRSPRDSGAERGGLRVVL